MKRLKEWSRSLALRNKMVKGMSTLIAVVLVVCCTACGNGKKVQEEDASVKEDTKKETSEKNLKDFIDIEDIYVRVNSKNVDLAKAVEIKKEKADVIDKVEVDTSKVDYTKTGKYDVVYTVTLKSDVVKTGTVKEKSENKSTENQTDTGSDDTKNENSTDSKDAPAKTEQEVITGDGEIEIVTEEKAKELAQAGKDVLTSDNQMMAKGDKTEDKKEDTKKENTKKEDKKETAKADDKRGNSNSSKGHTHNWVAQYTTVDDYQTVTDYQTQPVYENQPIYETRPVYSTEYHYICNCGYDCGTDREPHLASGCFAGYSVKPVTVQTGTETVQVGTQQVQVGTQQVAVGSHQEKVGSHQELTGYTCSECGAMK